MNRYIFYVSILGVVVGWSILVGVVLIGSTNSPFSKKPVSQISGPVEEASTTKVGQVNDEPVSPTRLLNIEPVSPTDKPGDVVGAEITTANVLNGTNAMRYEKDLPILKENPKLDLAARMKLDDMLARDYFAHNAPDGVSALDWIKRAGYIPTYWGENLARNFTNVQDTLTAWQNSPTHYANIMKPQYTETGIAVSGSYVVQVFAKPSK